MSQHTPGPWDVAGWFIGPFGSTPITDKHGREIASVMPLAADNPSSSSANARLIAQAPALRETLTELYDACEDYVGHTISGDTRYARAIFAARAILREIGGK